MSSLRKVFPRVFPALCLLAAACTAGTPPVTPALQPGDPLPHPPQPLAILAQQRLQAASDSRYPPPDFGKAIALGDGVLAVGAPSITGGEEYSAPGSVTIYRRDAAAGWVEEAQLKASNQDNGFQYAQHFGAALALQEPYLFVGAPASDDPQAGDNTGAVYIFEHGPNGWEEIAILKSPEPAAEAGFGTGLAIDGEHLGVMEGGTFRGGRLRLFQGRAADWRQTALIEAPQLEGTQGGFSTFDIYGTTLALGIAYYQGEGAETRISGQVLLYRFGGETWTAGEDLPQDVYGAQVALDGQAGTAERLAVASLFNPLNGLRSEAVFIYERSGEGWRLAETLASPDMGSFYSWGSGYGGSVALHGDLLLVGGPGFSEDSFWDGVAYLYQHSDGRWVDQLRLVPPEDGGFGDFFGSQVAVNGDILLVSAPNEFGNAVYVFEVGAR